MTKPLLISFSGGRTSAYMLRKILDTPIYHSWHKVIVFANTGKERPETLDFVKEISDRWAIKITWVEAVVNPEVGKGTTHKVVSYHSASRNGEPFESVIQKYGIPNQAFPHCTRELKQAPIKSYMRSLGYPEYVTAIGIRFDEPRRISNKRDFDYPLYRMGITEKHVRDFWNSQPFDLKLKSYEGNCDLCWKKSLRKKRTLLAENPQISEWWDEMEQKYSEGQYFFHRGNQSTKQIRDDESPFVPASDPYTFEAEMDEEKPCNCRTNLNED